jgi:hypothetical protein
MPHPIQVPSEIVRKWQEIVDLTAEIMHVPSALIMRVVPPKHQSLHIQRDTRESLRAGRSGLSQHGALL